MHSRFFSLVLVFAALAVFLVIQATRESAATVLLPSDLIKSAPETHRYRIRVAGKIVEPVEYRVEPALELKFSVKDPGNASNGAPLAVIYHGLKPDMFAAGRDVIIDGEYQGGILLASKLLTQCPSKYVPPDPSKMKSAQK